MKEPIIGLLGSRLVMPGAPFPGLERDYINHDYVEALRAAGAVPLLLPVLDTAAIAAQLSCVDAVVFPGGHDVDPFSYGQQPRRGIGEILPERDVYDLAVFQEARHMGLPILGICRGMQLINVACGGTLHQDVALAGPEVGNHWQGYPRHIASHTVEVKAGSLLAEAIGASGEVRVNSHHHQVVDKLGEGLRVSARALDGVVEAVESADGAWLLAVQWHPEMMAATSAPMVCLFKKFIDTIKKNSY